MRWVKVCKVQDLKEGEKMNIELEGRKILLVNSEGNYYAVDAICTHEYAELGIVLGKRIVCPLHLSQFDLETGEVLNPPATEPLKTYKVKIDGGEIYIEVD
ncbi:Naphthalene 1,2-dioxygenase system ferredoxin subunit [archaeon HR06]|nr:Naphthalene 1,2-dioxygenase system ferredoxin subunit [archaeon HR06]